VSGRHRGSIRRIRFRDLDCSVPAVFVPVSGTLIINRDAPHWKRVLCIRLLRDAWHRPGVLVPVTLFALRHLARGLWAHKAVTVAAALTAAAVTASTTIAVNTPYIQELPRAHAVKYGRGADETSRRRHDAPRQPGRGGGKPRPRAAGAIPPAPRPGARSSR
jgi:hypothetical protein